VPRLRVGILVLAVVTACAVGTPAGPAPAFASDVPATGDLKIPKAAIDWLRKNAAALYIVIDELIEDLSGCGCPPPPPPDVPPYSPPPPY
jgi:hypothetical protein